LVSVVRRRFFNSPPSAILVRYKDERPFGKNAPTAPVMKITGTGDIEQQKKE
jgi:hypothetical protein